MLRQEHTEHVLPKRVCCARRPVLCGGPCAESGNGRAFASCPVLLLLQGKELLSPGKNAMYNEEHKIVTPMHVGCFCSCFPLLHSLASGNTDLLTAGQATQAVREPDC